MHGRLAPVGFGAGVLHPTLNRARNPGTPRFVHRHAPHPWYSPRLGGAGAFSNALSVGVGCLVRLNPVLGLWPADPPKSLVGIPCRRSAALGRARVFAGLFSVLETSSYVPLSYTVSGSTCEFITATCLQSLTHTLSRPRSVFVAKMAQHRSAKRGHSRTYGRVSWEPLAC